MNKFKFISFEDHLDEQYGKLGTEGRKKFEEGFNAFMLEVMLQEMHREQDLKEEHLS